MNRDAIAFALVVAGALCAECIPLASALIGAARMRFIEAAYWGKSATLEEAALENMVPWQTAKKWHSEFVRLVASHYGLMD